MINNKHFFVGVIVIAIVLGIMIPFFLVEPSTDVVYAHDAIFSNLFGDKEPWGTLIQTIQVQNMRALPGSYRISPPTVCLTDHEDNLSGWGHDFNVKVGTNYLELKDMNKGWTLTEGESKRIGIPPFSSRIIAVYLPARGSNDLDEDRKYSSVIIFQDPSIDCKSQKAKQLAVSKTLPILDIPSGLNSRFDPKLAKLNVTSECTDSDGPDGYFTKGSVIVENDRSRSLTTDICICSQPPCKVVNQVKEYYCGFENRLKSEVYNCPYGCENGACIKI